VVLLRDGSWPQPPGVCCWRHGVHTAFAAAGATVVDVTHRPADPPVSGSGRRWMRWLPPVARRPLAAAYRGSRTVARGVSRLATARRRPGTLAFQLDGAALVVAESLTVAMAAVACGVPSRRLWALALPAERLFAGDRTGEAGALAAAVPAVGGFLTDREPARDSVERAAAPHRVRVELFPPVVADRPCPDCASPGAAPAAGIPTAVAQLARCRVRLGPGPVPGPRLGREKPVPWAGWDGAPVAAEPPDPEPPDPRAATQDRTARRLLDAVAPPASGPARPPRSALLAGYDLKFARELATHLDRRTDLTVTVDDWPELGQPTAGTDARLRAADAVFAEWARTSAVWLSRHTRPDQFLAVRLHRYELDYPYPREIAIDNVDAVVYIAPLFGRRIRDELGWPAGKLVHIPNFLDVDWLDRPKLPGARFALGFVGIEWSRKRFDLALDLLAAVRREDHRFRLVVRSVMPWHNRYVWSTPDEREYVGRCFTRIEQDPLLRDAVRFDPPGPDMARWYRQVGHVLSTSDAEGSHASVAEAMAAGSVPVIRAWPGAAEVYDPRWVHASTGAAAAAVFANADAGRWAERAAAARAEVRRTHDPVAVVEAWADLLHGDLPAARSRFPAPAPWPARTGALMGKG
jgi:glycosyltransferase involved in cell wall biosynthesis